MKDISIIVLIVIVGLFPFDGYSQKNVELGQKYFNLRAKNHKGQKAKLKYINKAIRNFEKSDQTPDVIASLLRAYEFKGSYTSLSKSKVKTIFEKALKLGEEAYAKYPDHIGVKYYYMTNMGRWAQEISLMTAATNGVSKDIKKLAEEIYAEDPYFGDAGASRILGVLHMKIPTVPFVVTWPSEEKGIEHLKWAYEKAPENPANVIFYAEAMIETGQESSAKKMLDELKSQKPRKDKLIEDLNNLERIKDIYMKYFDEEISF